MSNRGIIAIVLAIAFIGLLAFGLVAKNGAQIAVGEPAPDAVVPRLGEEGQASLEDYRGQWVLLNFWASWCGPCKDEAPILERFYKQNSDRMTIVGMDSQDAAESALEFIADYNLTYPMWSDVGGERGDAFGNTGFPENFLIDPDGNIALILRGPVDQQYLDEQVKPLITGETTPG